VGIFPNASDTIEAFGRLVGSHLCGKDGAPSGALPVNCGGCASLRFGGTAEAAVAT